jgi:Tfp pilus assembly protein PilX
MALLMGLVLLAALSLLALSSTSGMILQRHMASNFQENAVALEAAMLADAEARAWLLSRPDIQRQADCLADCFLPPGFRQADDVPARPEFQSAEWWRNHGIEAGLNPETGENRLSQPVGAEPARWILAEIHAESTGDAGSETTARNLAYYRIFSRGAGLHPGSVAVTESVAARPWGGSFEPGPLPPLNGPNPFCRQFLHRYDCGMQSWRRRR